MRTLFLIRHAKSSWDNPGLRDFNRPLNERGLHDAPRMAELLVKMGVQPDLIVSSPAKRALTTAQFFAGAFGWADDAVVRQQAIYEASAQDILRIVSELPETAQTVMLFGHNPTFTDVTNMLAGQSVDNVPTCGIVHLESEATGWAELDHSNSTLKGLYFPKELL